MRLKFAINFSPSTNTRRFAPDMPVTFAPMEAIHDGMGGLDISRTAPIADLKAGSYNVFSEGDVLLAKVTPCFENGKKCLAHDLTGGIGFATSEVHVIRPNQGKISPQFLMYLLSSEQFKAEGIISMTGSGGLKRVSAEAVLNHRIVVDDVSEQSAIADYLDRETGQIDGLIEKKSSFAALLKEKCLAFSDAAVTGSSAKELRDSGIPWASRIPAHWTVKKAKYLFREMARPVGEDDEIITAFRDGQVCLRRKRRAEGYTFAVKELGYQHIKQGDLVIHTMDAFAGAIGVSEDDGKATGEYAVCEPRSSDVSPEYYALLLRCMARRNYIYVLCPSVRERAPRFRFVRFAPVRLPVPPIDEQIQIVEEVGKAKETFDKSIEMTERSIALLKEKRAALITAAVTGKIDVRAAA